MTFPTAIRFTPAALPVFDPAWKARCLTCANVRQKGTTLQCAVVKAPDSYRWPAHCIDARDGACGPTAVLWQRKS